MKLNCGLTKEEKLQKTWDRWQKEEEWHDFFTILPRRVGHRDCRFLETIERKGVIVYSRPGYYEQRMKYRAKERLK